MAVRILCVGDMHLGREPGRVPEEVLRETGLKRSSLAASAAWAAAVQEARQLKVAAVLLAGDLVDSDDGFLAACGPLEKGVAALIDEGIAVVAVAGNHDTRVLPRLAKRLPGLTLLGQGGEWQTTLIEVEGQPVLRILGWSFPTREVRYDPLAKLHPEFSRGEFADGARVPTIGLIHGDLDAQVSLYAPLARPRLEAVPCKAWLLGHIHKPSEFKGAQPIGYLGCLAGNDPSEPGPRGPWLGTIESGSLTLEHLPRSPLRWEELEINLEGVQTAEGLEERLWDELRHLDKKRCQEGCSARVVGLRPRLVGSTKVSHDIRAEVMAKAHTDFRSTFDTCTYFVDRKFIDEARPDWNIEAISHGSDPLAVLAQILCGLEGESSDREDPDLEDFIERTRQAMHAEANHKNFAGLNRRAITSADARAELVGAARRAFEELAAQSPTSKALPEPAAEQLT